MDLVKRNFVPGEEWVFFKIYLGKKTADKVLVEAIKPLVLDLLKKKKIDGWFFIRYTDPDFHLRIRLHCSKSLYIGSILRGFYKSISRYTITDFIWKVQIDTYQREIERYGNSTIELSERLFFIDSDSCLNIISLTNNDYGETQRWLSIIKMVDMLLDCFQYKTEEKLQLIQTIKDGFGKEFGMNPLLKKQLDAKFLREKKLIEKCLYFNDLQNSILLPFTKVFDSYSFSISSVAQEIKNANDNSTEGIRLDDLISSYIHMMMNRMFISRQRAYEMVLYDFLFRHYKSVIARTKA